MEIRRQLTDSSAKQSGAWCGLHALNFLRSPGTEIHTRKDARLSAQLQAENQTIGPYHHKDMVLKDGWITIDFLRAYMTRKMGLEEPPTFLPVRPPSSGKYRTIQALYTEITKQSSCKCCRHGCLTVALLRVAAIS